jgi:two-component system, response regulator PdtaR
VFEAEQRIITRMAPRLKRVMVVDPQPHSTRMFTELMRDLVGSHVFAAANNDRAGRIAESSDPQLIVVEIGEGDADGLAFTRRLRRSTWTCRQAPVIAVTGNATAAMILAARDAGVHEFLRKPYSVKDLLRRLEAVTLRERDWVEGVAYIGPDRRRFNSGEYAGPLKRKTDGSETPLQQKINQALKIVRAAVAAAETDPAQALRAMTAQASTLQTIAIDFQLTLAASEFQRVLSRQAASKTPFTRKDAEGWAARVLSFLPKDADANRHAAAA